MDNENEREVDATSFSIQLSTGRPVGLIVNGKEYAVTERSEEARALVEEMVEALKEVIEVGVQKTEGPYSRKNNKCKHGRYGYEGCETCVEEFLTGIYTKATAWLNAQKGK